MSEYLYAYNSVSLYKYMISLAHNREISVGICRAVASMRQTEILALVIFFVLGVFFFFGTGRKFKIST